MKCFTDSAIELTWPGVPVTACASMRPLPVEHAGREIAALAHDRRERRAHQRLRLLLDHRDQAVPHDLQVDQACGVGHALALRSITIHPAASIRASKLAVTNVEVSSSAMIAGPVTRTPGSMRSRR